MITHAILRVVFFLLALMDGAPGNIALADRANAKIADQGFGLDPRGPGIPFLEPDQEEIF